MILSFVFFVDDKMIFVSILLSRDIFFLGRFLISWYLREKNCVEREMGNVFETCTNNNTVRINVSHQTEMHVLGTLLREPTKQTCDHSLVHRPQESRAPSHVYGMRLVMLDGLVDYSETRDSAGEETQPRCVCVSLRGRRLFRFTCHMRLAARCMCV